MLYKGRKNSLLLPALRNSSDISGDGLSQTRIISAKIPYPSLVFEQDTFQIHVTQHYLLQC